MPPSPTVGDIEEQSAVGAVVMDVQRHRPLAAAVGVFGGVGQRLSDHQQDVVEPFAIEREMCAQPLESSCLNLATESASAVSVRAKSASAALVEKFESVMMSNGYPAGPAVMQ